MSVIILFGKHEGTGTRVTGGGQQDVEAVPPLQPGAQGSLWKDPTSGTENPQNSESTHFPLLYHLLLLRNYYHNSQHFYRTESYPADQPQPLDLSVKAKEGYLSAFTKERKKISCDESIKDIEEVEVVYKEDKVKPESVKEFVERKIKEYKKAEENFESFVNK